MATYSDAFTRADSSTTLGTTDTGQAWSALQGTWGIASNQARCVSAVDDDDAVITTDGPGQTVSAVVTLGAGNDNPGIIARCTDHNNRYLVSMSTLGAMALFKKVTGTYTSLGSAIAGTVASGNTVTLRTVGTSIIVKVNGTAVISVTDSSLTTGSKAGLRFGNGGGAPGSTRWDDFLVTTSTPAAVTSTFAIHLVSTTVVDVYRNGTREARYSHNAFSGAFFALSTFFGIAAGAHVDTVTIKTAPAGTTLATYTFADLTAWTVGLNGADWYIDPASYATTAGSSDADAVITVAQPAGGDYVEATGVYFEGTGVPDGWIMLSPYWPNSLTNTSGTFTNVGYRLFLRPNGSLELADNTGVLSITGWQVGSVAL